MRHVSLDLLIWICTFAVQSFNIIGFDKWGHPSSFVEMFWCTICSIGWCQVPVSGAGWLTALSESRHPYFCHKLPINLLGSPLVLCPDDVCSQVWEEARTAPRVRRLTHPPPPTRGWHHHPGHQHPALGAQWRDPVSHPSCDNSKQWWCKDSSSVLSSSTKANQIYKILCEKS